MTAKDLVTVWHRCGDDFVRSVYPARIKLIQKIDRSGIKHKGYFSEEECRVRIPTRQKLDIAASDFIQIGARTGNPDRTRDFKIVAVSDNTRSVSAHFRIDAKR